MLLASTVAASVVAFLIAGISGLMVVVNCAYVGGLAGIMKRRGRGTPPTVIAVGLVAGVIFGVFIIAALTVLVRLRTLTFSAMTANFDGVVSVMSRFEPFRPAAEDARHMFGVALQYWPALLMVYAIFSIMVVTLVGWWALSRVLDRLRGIPDVHKLETPPAESGPVAPVPVRLVDARFSVSGRRPRRTAPAELDRRRRGGTRGDHRCQRLREDHADAAAVRASTDVGHDRAARRDRLGSAGWDGRDHAAPRKSGAGNTSRRRRRLRPAAGNRTDIAALLDEVGLAGMEERDTGGLSGGELQRLAVAAALARQPSMLIADEVTSMVDQRGGREALLSVLSGLTERHRMALVSITHYNNEADTAERVINLSESLDNTNMVESADAPTATESAPPRKAEPVLELEHVTHEYAAGTPWAKPALTDVTFTVHEGEGLLIHGGNGSGKSTLAWIMAGLTTPTSGSCLVRGRPAPDCVARWRSLSRPPGCS